MPCCVKNFLSSKKDFIDYIKIPHVQCGCEILNTSNYNKEREKNWSRAACLGSTRRPRRVGLGRTPRPPPPSLPLCWAARALLAALVWAAHVLLIMLGWIAPLLRLFVLDRVATVLRRLSASGLGFAALSTLGGIHLQPLRWAVVVPTLLVAGFALLCWSSCSNHRSSSSCSLCCVALFAVPFLLLLHVPILVVLLVVPVVILVVLVIRLAFVVLTPPLSEGTPPTSLWGGEGR